MGEQENAFQPGDILLGKYRIEHVLGQGGMGIVVAARHVDLGQLFAIKLLQKHALKHSEALKRFLREARAAASLESEHVAKVVDVGRLDHGGPYMVMEHLTGTDLSALLKSEGPLACEDAVTYLLHACDALAEAHDKGIIHRDLKPANLFLVRRANGSACVKVLDFGISKQIDPENVDLTKTGSMLGSPLYMSPEQMMRTKDADARSDIWSLGVVLYELVTGSPPFSGETVTEVVANVLQTELRPASAVRADIASDLDRIIGRCLEKKPESRFQSVAELAAALRPVIGLPSLAPPATDRPATTGRDAPPSTEPKTTGRTLQGSTVDAAEPAPNRNTTRLVLLAAGALAAVAAGVWLTRDTSGGAAADANGSVAPPPPLAAPSAAPPIATAAPVDTPAPAENPSAVASTPSARSLARPSPLATPRAAPSASAVPAPAPSAAPPPSASRPASKHEGIF